jgi:hypothetical protein
MGLWTNHHQVNDSSQSLSYQRYHSYHLYRGDLYPFSSSFSSSYAYLVLLLLVVYPLHDICHLHHQVL